ncbi:MAG: sigma-70 family RNA polymerase sigma factor [Calothrix sp. C42_A2020_038]|nr:sigma-70 family RNA polymerase sigma factor [Calothrix sp. C42_A2020_038]
MQLRQGITEIFSTFVLFEADRFGAWMTDAKLRRSIKNCLEQSPQIQTDKVWVLYWHKIWQTESSAVAAAHISAYLQEACYWTAKKIALNLKNQCTISDCFQIAIARVPKILKNFNPELGYNLKNYAEFAFEGFIKDSLRLHREADICSDYALLHKVSRKRLIDALTNAGYNNQIIDSYVLAWECFKELYTSEGKKTRSLSKPSMQNWQGISQLYNQLYSVQQSTKLIYASRATPEDLEKWLASCSGAVRNYMFPKMVSADAPFTEKDAGNLLDILPADEGTSLLKQIITQEEEISRRHQQVELSKVLTDAIAALDTLSQLLLQVYYQEQLTQQQIAEKLNMKQYTVSRRLTSIKRTLLLALSQWSANIMHKTPTPDVLDAISKSLEEWLKTHYSQTNCQANH